MSNSAVKVQATGQDHRLRDENWVRLDKGYWKLPAQEAYDEDWRRAKAVLREHPFRGFRSIRATLWRILVLGLP
jgi:hypothetical protein